MNRVGEVDTVAVVAIGGRGASEYVVLLSRFRPPASSIVVEFVSGPMKLSEDVSMAARRLLKERTGLCGRLISESEPLFCDSAVSDSNVRIATVYLTQEHSQLERGQEIEAAQMPTAQVHVVKRKEVCSCT
jgi:8-oxo-dGTP pyrophosphatase MutT (NUDIX family)